MTRSIFLLVLLATFAKGQKKSTCPFTCANEHEFTFYGDKVIKCEKGLICNEKCTIGSGTVLKICGTVDDFCPHSCNGKEITFFDNNGGSHSGTCPTNMECNQLLDSCRNMCVPGKCTNTDLYKCINSTSYNILGFVGSCPSGSVCNIKQVQPCEVCLPDTSLEKPGVTTTQAVPTEPPTTSFPLPNCNNPSGTIAPCRYGPKGYYFKCVRTSNNNFIADLKSCTFLKFDNICSRFQLC